MDECTLWEIDNLLEYIDYADMQSWKQTRVLAYLTAQVNSTKSLKPEEILKLPWEKTDAQRKAEAIAELPKEISNEDVATFNNAMGFGAMAMNKGKRRLKNGDTQH